MGSNRQRARNGQRGSGDCARDVSAQRRVEHLRQSFAKFRRQHRPGTRIPHTLRDAMLAAVESGTTEPEVRRTCGVTAEQLAQWQQRRRSGARQANGPRRRLRSSRLSIKCRACTSTVPVGIRHRVWSYASGDGPFASDRWRRKAQMARREQAQRGHICCP